MMKHLNYKVSTLFAAAALTLSGCSDDFDFNNRNENTDGNGVMIYVPYVSEEAETRASDHTRATRDGATVWDFDGNEDKIESLFLLAYPKGGGEMFGEELDTSKGVNVDGYTGYKVDIPVGNYEMFVVANYDLATNKLYKTISKEDLLDLHVDATTLSASDGLPMSCSELKVKNGNTYDTKSEIKIDASDNDPIYADLKFAVAKVRVSLINDIDPSRQVKENKGTLSNVFKNSYLFAEDKNYGSRSSLEISGGYYQLPSFFDDETNKELTPNTVNLDGLIEYNDTPNADGSEPWVWQTTEYVGEYLFGGTTPADANKFTVTVPLTAGNDAKTIINTSLIRSTFYDIVGTPDGKFFCNVQPWDPVVMAMSAHGAYYLHIDRTGFTVKAGEAQEITYDTNGILDISGQPKYNGKEIYEIKIDERTHKILVQLSSEMTKADVAAIKANQPEGWNKIVIKAGTLKKYIDVVDIVYSEYLTTPETSITLDVAERIGSGSYYGDVSLAINTNKSPFTITRIEGWDEIDAETFETKSVTLQTPEGVNFPETLNGTVTAGDNSVKNIGDGKYQVNFPDNPDGAYNLRISYTGLNDGDRQFWKSGRHVLKIQVEANVEHEDGTIEPVKEIITITVVPSNDKYVIHAKIPSGWAKTPHIYAYQCLMFPGDMSPYCDASHPYSNYSYLELKPVGALNNNGDRTVAALEYSFTGKLAFKGWSKSGDNSPTQTVVPDNGFYYFFNNGKSWNGSDDGWDKHYNIMDFCAKYRLNCACGDCKGESYNRGWPGIRMEKEDGYEDWYRFELTGIATPGRTLLIFSDRHGGDGIQQKPKEAGYPLFDYPSREGWIDLTVDDPIFTSEDIRTSSGDPIDPTFPSNSIFYIHGNFSGSWSPVKMTNTNGIWSCEIETTQTTEREFGIRRTETESTNDNDQKDWIWGSSSTVTFGTPMTCIVQNSDKNNGTNWKVTGAGKYKFEFIPEDMTLKITKETVSDVFDYAIRGSIFSSGENQEGSWYDRALKDEDGDGIWELNNVTCSQGSFGFRYRKNKNQVTWYDASSSGFTCVGADKNSSNNNWDLSAGTYSFLFDEKNMTLIVYPYHSSATKVDMYLAGDITGWSTNNSNYKFNSSDGITYTLTVSNMNTNGFKFCGGNWDTRNFGLGENDKEEGTYSLYSNGDNMTLNDSGNYTFTLKNLKGDWNWVILTIRKN